MGKMVIDKKSAIESLDRIGMLEDLAEDPHMPPAGAAVCFGMIEDLLEDVRIYVQAIKEPSDIFHAELDEDTAVRG